MGFVHWFFFLSFSLSLWAGKVVKVKVMVMVMMMVHPPCPSPQHNICFGYSFFISYSDTIYVAKQKHAILDNIASLLSDPLKK